jgi:hypothetical protein
MRVAKTGHGVVFANDHLKDGASDSFAEHKIRLRLGDIVTVGGGTTNLISEICSGAVVGTGSVVTEPALVEGNYAGNPATLLILLSLFLNALLHWQRISAGGIEERKALNLRQHNHLSKRHCALGF